MVRLRGKDDTEQRLEGGESACSYQKEEAFQATGRSGLGKGCQAEAGPALQGVSVAGGEGAVAKRVGHEVGGKQGGVVPAVGRGVTAYRSRRPLPGPHLRL